MESSCMDLALEGERLCKAGDYHAGVSYFESAIQVGTEDLQTLSAIYSQLGNAYFRLQEYDKALEYHRHDLTLTRTIGDELGEAKASGNLGNTLKLLGRYDEAIVCCQRHLDITRAVYDKVGQARALYNFGNVYHAKGKSIWWSGGEPGEFPEEAKTALKKAAQYYEANLCLVKELGDRAAQGRTYGNLGNTYYLLGDFESAVAAHEKRLLIAKEFGDKSAERRAHCNLGNAHIFLSQFEVAAGHYKRTLQLARLLKDKAVEAQACYNLGNTYTLLQDYERAIDYHLKHLVIAQDLKDRVGEGRAYWSLGNAHTALGNHEQAMYLAEKHLEIAKEVLFILALIQTGDKGGEVTAKMNLSDLRLVVRLKSHSNVHHMLRNTNTSIQGHPDLPESKSSLRRRNSAENQEQSQSPPKPRRGDSSPHQLKIKKKNSKSASKGREENHSEHTVTEQDSPVSSKLGQRDTVGEDSFFDLLSRFQGSRMDDQRCSLDGQSRPSAPPTPPSNLPVAEEKSTSKDTSSQDPGHFLELLASSQDRRLNDQRASLSPFPGLRLSTCSPPHTPSASTTDPAPSQAANASHTPSLSNHIEGSAEQPEADNVFFDMLVKCQGSRLNDQRCVAPSSKSQGPTIPNEDFFSLILRAQSNRMEEQRVSLPSGLTQTKPDG